MERGNKNKSGQKEKSSCDAGPMTASDNAMGHSGAKLELSQVELKWPDLYYLTSISYWKDVGCHIRM